MGGRENAEEKDNKKRSESRLIITNCDMNTKKKRGKTKKMHKTWRVIHLQQKNAKKTTAAPPPPKKKKKKKMKKNNNLKGTDK